jgi:hypothetical protein
MQGEWIRKPQDGSAVIFVHGILSSANSCWRNENGCYWPGLVAKDPRLRNTGVYVYSYQTGIFSGDYSLSDIVDDLKARTNLDQIKECTKLIFVCHSMGGGIVVRKLLVEREADFVAWNSEIGLFLLASPSLGASYADMLTALVKSIGNTQADALRFVNKNYWLKDLDKEFINLKESGRIRMTGQELVEDKFIFLRRILRRQV